MSIERKKSEVIWLPEPPPGPLKTFDLYTMALGSAVGAGVITFVGTAITYTGYSAWLAYALGVVWGLFIVLPHFFTSSTFRLGGGEYSTLGALADERVAGVYALSKTLSALTVGMYGASFAAYLASLLPNVQTRLIAVLVIAFFYVLNLYGVKAAAKVQNVMFIALVAALGIFIIFAIPHVNPDIFNFSHENFFTGGSSGFFSAVVLLGSSCQAYYIVSMYGRQCRDATRDIPKAMLWCVPTIFILYVGCAIAGVGVLPLEEVAGKPLTMAAKTVLPGPLFLFFMIGGPLVAIATSINGIIPGTTNLIGSAAENGWLPKSLATRNKHGVQWKVLTLICLVGAIPCALGMNASKIMTMANLFTSTMNILYLCCVTRIPTKFPEAWKNSRLHMPNFLFYILMTISICVNIFVFYNSSKNLTLTNVLISVCLMIICAVYALVRVRRGGIRLAISLWPRKVEEEKTA